MAIAMSSSHFLVRRGSTALPNKTVLDRELSYVALGLLVAALAMPPSAPKGYRAFVDAKRGLGRDAVLKGLKELSELGYRWQFTVRTTGGVVRTVTVISDERISEHVALEECVARRDYAYVIECKNTGTSYRPAEPNSVDEEPESRGVSAGHTVRRNSGARSESESTTVRRNSVARQPSAPPLRGVTNSSLRSELTTNQPRDAEPPDEDQGPPSIPDPPPTSRCGPSDGEVSEAAVLVAKCLPPKWRGMDRSGMVEVGRLLRERLDAGWKQTEIRAVMDNQQLPESGVLRLAGLARHRIIANIDPTLSPAALKESHTSTLRVAVVASVDEHPADAAWGAVWEETWERVVSQSPQLSKVDQLHHAQADLTARGLTKDVFTDTWRALRGRNPHWTDGEVTAHALDALSAQWRLA